MLDTAIYDADLQLIKANSLSAAARGDTAATDRILRHLANLLDYAQAQGLRLDTRYGAFCFVHSGYEPGALHITTSQQEGQIYR